MLGSTTSDNKEQMKLGMATQESEKKMLVTG
jgi:hypothetical protein